ncbi:hypothetical protein TNCV_1331371 [Trichonephila clavipes]|nr:hypothetical protein TNCV_1331371 [Trichonephila clavipes]
MVLYRLHQLIHPVVLKKKSEVSPSFANFASKLLAINSILLAAVLDRRWTTWELFSEVGLSRQTVWHFMKKCPDMGGIVDCWAHINSPMYRKDTGII